MKTDPEIRYLFAPLPDITAYELALVLPLASNDLRSQDAVTMYIDGLPDAVKRHIKVNGQRLVEAA